MTWVVLSKEQADPAKAKAMTDFFIWALHEGQTAAEPLHFGRVPQSVVSAIEKKLGTASASVGGN